MPAVQVDRATFMDTCVSPGARNCEETSQSPPATRTTGMRACDDAIRTHAAPSRARAYALYLLGRASALGGSGRVPYIVSMGSPLRAGVRGLGFAGAAAGRAA